MHLRLREFIVRAKLPRSRITPSSGEGFPEDFEKPECAVRHSEISHEVLSLDLRRELFSSDGLGETLNRQLVVSGLNLDPDAVPPTTRGRQASGAGPREWIKHRIADKAEHPNQRFDEFDRIRAGWDRVEAPRIVTICLNHSLWDFSPMTLRIRIASLGRRYAPGFRRRMTATRLLRQRSRRRYFASQPPSMPTMVPVT